MPWLDYITESPITDISQLDPNAIGFVYMIKYDDGTAYIGKKNLYSTIKLNALKNGTERKGHLEFRQKNTGKGNRKTIEVVKVESDWKRYKGSHKDCKDKTYIKKYILECAYSKIQLTYLETMYLFEYHVLENEKFINDNILGKFYRNQLIND